MPGLSWLTEASLPAIGKFDTRRTRPGTAWALCTNSDVAAQHRPAIFPQYLGRPSTWTEQMRQGSLQLSVSKLPQGIKGA